MRPTQPRSLGLPSRLQHLADLAGSVVALAEMAGISRKSLTDWLTEKRPPSGQGMRKLVDRLGIDQGWLLTGEGEMPRAISGGVVRTDATALFDCSDPSNRSILSADASWLRIHLGLSASNVLLYHPQDDQMAPTICRGEPVLARVGGSPDHHIWRLHVVRHQGIVMVRYIKSMDNGGGVGLRTENNVDDYGYIATEGSEDGINILGEVVWYGTKVLPYVPPRPRAQSLPGQAPMRRRVQ